MVSIAEEYHDRGLIPGRVFERPEECAGSRVSETRPHHHTIETLLTQECVCSGHILCGLDVAGKCIQEVANPATLRRVVPHKEDSDEWFVHEMVLRID